MQISGAKTFIFLHFSFSLSRPLAILTLQIACFIPPTLFSFSALYQQNNRSQQIYQHMKKCTPLHFFCTYSVLPYHSPTF